MRAMLLALLAATPALAQTPPNLAAFKGLAPATRAGKAVLAANETVTAGIQAGTAGEPLPLPFPAQQRQALADAYITSANANQLADGLGTALGAAYRSAAPCTSAGACKENASPRLTALFAYAASLAGADSNAAKFFLANATKDGTQPVSAEAAAIAATTDMFGKATHHPAGSPNMDPFGNSRPFQTEPSLLKFTAPDFFGVPASNVAYLYGPAQDLTRNPSFPSGHTTYGATESLLLAMMVPERFPQMLARAAEYGNDRVIIGAHYAMDVIAGRTLALYDMAHLLANDPAYVGQHLAKTKVSLGDFPAALNAATQDLRAALAAKCGTPIAVCAAADTGRFTDAKATRAFVAYTQTYTLPAVYPAKREEVYALAPDAGRLLETRFPGLSLKQRDSILTKTESPGGGFLDNGSEFGVYSRLDLYAAAQTRITGADRDAR